MPMPLDGDPLPGLRFTKPFPATLVDGCAPRPAGNQAVAGGARPLGSLFREGEGKKATAFSRGGAGGGRRSCSRRGKVPPAVGQSVCVCVGGG